MTRFTAIIPVKEFCWAKTRLSGNPFLRSSLAKAFALDVISAAGQASMIESVVTVTKESRGQFVEADEDVHVISEQPRNSGDALNEAVKRGADWSRVNRPGQPVVVVPADLAAITARDLDETLVIASTVRTAHVVDVGGTGTTLLTALDARDLCSHYGSDSARLHRLAGYSAMARVNARLRRDVDTPADLQDAITLGVGPATHEILGFLRLEPT